MPRVQDALPSLDCRAWKGRSNPLLLNPLRFAPESREPLANRLDHLPLTRDDLEHLGHILAELRELRRAAARAVHRCRDHHPLAWQVFGKGLARRPLAQCTIVARQSLADPPWIPERSATCLREADLNVLSKLGNQGLEWRLEPEAFTRREVRREDDLLDILVGCPIDIQVAWQPST